MDVFFDKIENFISFLKKESESSLFAELCALIGLNKENKIVYRKMQNRSKNPDLYFIIDPYEYLQFLNSFKMIAVFHSHLTGCEKPSEFDEKTSENCCLPFIIYSICSEKFFIYEPKYKDYDVNTIQRLKELM
jgi:proteasome lid subunit RPN8/RPN11